jgi:hypothetical protein
VPFPSLADAGFLGFPVLAAAALLALPAGADVAVSRVRDLLDGVRRGGHSHTLDERRCHVVTVR